MEYAAAGRGSGDREPGGPVVLQECGSLAPMFTAHVDDARGTVRVRGHLDVIGAEELAVTVRRLIGQGRERVTVELGGYGTADQAATDLLTRLAVRDAVIVVH